MLPPLHTMLNSAYAYQEKHLSITRHRNHNIIGVRCTLVIGNGYTKHICTRGESGYFCLPAGGAYNRI